MNYTSDNAESAIQATPEATALNGCCDIRLFKHTQASTPAGLHHSTIKKSLSD